MKLIDKFNTRYFHNGYNQQVFDMLNNEKPKVIDLTGARMTPLVLSTITSYVLSDDTVTVNDDRPLILEYIDGCRVERKINNAEHVVIHVPSSNEEKAAQWSMFKKENKNPTDKCYKLTSTASCSNDVAACWYILLNLQFPKVKFLYEATLGSAMSQIFKSIVESTPKMKSDLSKQETITVIFPDSNIVKLTKKGDLFDLGVYGKFTFDEVLRKYTVLPVGFGENKVDITKVTEDSEWYALIHHCVNKVMSYINSFKQKPMDLYTILEKGSI